MLLPLPTRNFAKKTYEKIILKTKNQKSLAFSFLVCLENARVFFEARLNKPRAKREEGAVGEDTAGQYSTRGNHCADCS